MLIKPERLIGVHHNLITIVTIAAQTRDLFVIEGVRDIERQKILVARGSSWTMDSKHLIQPDGLSHAVDVAPYLDTDGDGDAEISWSWPDYYPVAETIKGVAAGLGIKIKWGGEWRRHKDGPHWQLE